MPVCTATTRFLAMRICWCSIRMEFTRLPFSTATASGPFLNTSSSFDIDCTHALKSPSRLALRSNSFATFTSSPWPQRLPPMTSIGHWRSRLPTLGLMFRSRGTGLYSVLYSNGDTSKCWSGEGGRMILKVWQRQRLGNWQFAACRALGQG